MSSSGMWMLSKLMTVQGFLVVLCLLHCSES